MIWLRDRPSSPTKVPAFCDTDSPGFLWREWNPDHGVKPWSFEYVSDIKKWWDSLLTTTTWFLKIQLFKPSKPTKNLSFDSWTFKEFRWNVGSEIPRGPCLQVIARRSGCWKGQGSLGTRRTSEVERATKIGGALRVEDDRGHFFGHQPKQWCTFIFGKSLKIDP